MAYSINIGKGLTLDVDATRFNPEVRDYVMQIGLRNILMDCHAGINQKAKPDLSGQDVVDQSKAVALKKLDAMYAGEARSARGGGGRPSGDPVVREATKIAKARIKAVAATQDGKAKILARATAGGVTIDELIASMTAKLAERPDIVAEAKANIEKAQAAMIDLDDI